VVKTACPSKPRAGRNRVVAVSYIFVRIYAYLYVSYVFVIISAYVCEFVRIGMYSFVFVHINIFEHIRIDLCIFV